MTRHVTSADGTQIAVERLGTGPALVIVDGAGCSRQLGASHDWAPLLAKQFTVHIYDRRGRGESTDTAPYSTEKEVDDLRAVIDVAGPAPYLVGFSTGAVLTRAAVAANVATSGLALFEPPPLRAGDHEAALASLVDAGAASKAVSYWMTKVVGVPALTVTLMRLLARRSWPLLVAAAPTLRYDLALLRSAASYTPARDVPVLVLDSTSPEATTKAIIAFFAPG